MDEEAVTSERGAIDRLREAINEEGTASAWADSVGLSRQYVGDVLARRRPPGPRLLSALGLVRETRIVARRS
ncbi:hypothetical protein FV226_27055 [Methylobacterium sp. WL12]|uniref:hypothetical protein n=1 Tax=Methylobacterium sp. WL12 TaxID=2603890 RepID=UPI0011CC1C36|nr:hypothetical protein [Methylobacterium sp. WL12]TXM63962.1 hypothetical protein FV226_27055 [Methylobacterium sp. WL12]